MASSPHNIVRRERIVALVTACIVIVLLVGGVWATRHGSSDGEPVALASPSAAPVPQATRAAAGASPALTAASSLPPALSRSQAAVDDAQTESSPPTPGGGEQTQTPSATPSHTSATPSATPTPTPKPTKSRTPTPTPTKTAPAPVPDAPFIVVQGNVRRRTYLTVKQLTKMNVFTGDYFSRGKEPPEATNAFVGVRLIDLLKAAGLKDDASKVDVRAADDYSASFSLRQVKAAWIDETRPGVTLPMIIAWSEDGIAYTGDHPFRLVMGQAVEGDYNRQYWVSFVLAITVQ